MVAKGEDEKQAEHEQFAKFDGWCTGSENNADTEIKLLTEKVGPQNFMFCCKFCSYVEQGKSR